MRKKILKVKPSDNDQIARISRRSTLLNQEYEQWWYDSWFIDEFSEESSELSSESEEFKKFDFTYWDIQNHLELNWRKLNSPHVEQFDIWKTIFSRRYQKFNLHFILESLRRWFWYSNKKHEKKLILGN